MNVRNILVFPAGTEIGLEINAALKNSKEVNVFGAGVVGSNHGPFAFDNFNILPSIFEEGWLEQLIKLCITLKIEYIFPAYDDVIVALAESQDKIPAKILTASLDTCRITRSKRKTYKILEDIVRVPKIYDVEIPTSDKYPLFLKPDSGQGSQGVSIISGEPDLIIKKGEINDPLLCEYLPGDEYTVDCFSDRDLGLLFCGARIRMRMRNGIAVSTVPVEIAGIQEIAEKISLKLGMRGAWFFQVKKDISGDLVLLEVAPRIAGSMSTHRVLGVNFPLLTIFEEERLEIQILHLEKNIKLDRALQNKFKHFINFSTLYIDLDDTIIVKGLINLDAISLIYKCINDGIKIVLITRHKGDLNITLQKYKILNLFDEVIHIKSNSFKSSYIKENKSIFIDDSFSERLDVSKNCNIPTFDCSMIELLLNSIGKLK
jgi:carbamoyl-phosphate synthase large subunit